MPAQQQLQTEPIDLYNQHVQEGDGQEVDDKACNFCGYYDENFNEDSIDIHYGKECPMLTTCWECEQVIEIFALNDHLIEECQSRDKYKPCNKCNSMFLNTDFYGHQCVRP